MVNQREGSAPFSMLENMQRGEVVTLYAGSTDCPEITWTHERVERDLAWGSLSATGLPPLPSDAYIYRSGWDDSASFGSVVGRGREYGLNGGTVYLRPPLPSQYPKRANLRDPSPTLAFPSASEVDALCSLLGHYRSIGFAFEESKVRDFAKRFGFFDFQIHKTPLQLDVMVQKNPGSWIVGKPNWIIWANDWSHRNGKGIAEGSRVGHLATLIFKKDGVNSFKEVLQAVEGAIDAVVERNR